jgi:hypothetical protein
VTVPQTANKLLWQHPVTGWQLLFTQVSTFVQSLSDVQQPAIGVCTHEPVDGLQAAVLHGLAGQLTGVSSHPPVAGLHAETVHWSGATQTFWCASHVWVERLQEAIVHRLGAVQSASASQHPGIGAPEHWPLAVHASGPVQTCWSSHDTPAFATF